MNTAAQRGPLYVLSGPSGAGKTTVVQRAIALSSAPFYRVVTATTRSPRSGECDGVDYHFWGVPRFQKAIADGELLEYARVFGLNFYGTPRSEVEPKRALGLGVLCVIDVQGAEQIRAAYPADHVSIFLDVPSLAVLETRLRARGTETGDHLTSRLEQAEAERAHAGRYQHRIVNDEVELAVAQLVRILERGIMDRTHTEPRHAG